LPEKIEKATNCARTLIFLPKLLNELIFLSFRKLFAMKMFLTTEAGESFLLRMPTIWRITIGMVNLVSLFGGTFMKILVYRHFKTAKFWDRPINVLILIDEIIHHSTYTYFILLTSMWALTNTYGANLISEWTNYEINNHMFCKIFIVVGSFSFNYGSVGSFGIGIYRLIYVTKTKWIRKLGENCLLAIISTFCLLFTLVMAGVYTANESTGRMAFNACNGRSQIFQVKILLNYFSTS
jgi:hypothetical protein